MSTTPEEVRSAKATERALGFDDRPEVLEWVAEAVSRAERTISFTLPGSFPQSITYLDPVIFHTELMTLAARKAADDRG